MIKVGIVGSRTFDDYQFLTESMDDLFLQTHWIVSGGAKGADTLAEKYAHERGYFLTVFRPDLKKHKSFGAAAFARNQEIVDFSDVIVAFWDGKSKGTRDTINKAAEAGKKVHIFRF